MRSEPSPVTSRPVVSLDVPVDLGLLGVARFLTSLEVLGDESVRIAVLRGSPEVFCRGMDLSEISRECAPEQGPAWVRAAQDFTRVLGAIRAAKPITIAVVEGPALGGGVGLAAACDFVVASEGATFALPELLLGLVPAMILPVLAERLGLHHAKRWAMTQATWKADEARTAGLVDRLVHAERLSVELDRMLRLLLRSHPRGVVILKRLAHEIRDLDVDSAIDHGQATLSALLGQVDVRNELIAFRDFGLLPGEAEV
jgi:enoyl-CoA hydratase/carnithine racemase